MRVNNPFLIRLGCDWKNRQTRQELENRKLDKKKVYNEQSHAKERIAEYHKIYYHQHKQEIICINQLKW